MNRVFMPVRGQIVALWLIALLLVQPVLSAAQSDAALTVQVIEGQGAIQNTARTSGFESVVEVQDATGRPVSGATVVFTLPSVGPGGTFADASHTLVTKTDENGRAIGRGFRPNRLAGQFEIRVTASHDGHTASASITQTNAAPVEPSKRSGRKWAILLGVAGGAAAAVAVAASGGKSSAAPTPSAPADVAAGSITPGAPSFGPPR